MTAVELCNTALTLIGEKRITALTDESRGGVLCNALYQQAIKEVLAERDWACAREKIRLNYNTATATISSADPGTVLITTNTGLYQVGDRIIVDEATCAADPSFATYLEEHDELYLDTNATANTYDLIDEDGDDINLATDYGAVDATCTIRIGDFKYQYRYSLPTDYVAIREVYNLIGDWEISRGCLYCDEEPIFLCYTKMPSDVDDLSEWLTLPIAYNLAAKLVTAIKGDGLNDYMRLYFLYLNEAKKIEARNTQEKNDPEFEYVIDV
jgi:hypothetical protein